MFDRVDMMASFEKRYDADGTVWVQAYAVAGATAKTPYKILVDENGPIAAALSDSATAQHYIGVPEKTVTSGAVGWFQIGGLIEDMITPSLSVSVGHALIEVDGAVADAGADFSGAVGQFAVCTTASTSSTTQDAILVPERIIGTT